MTRTKLLFWAALSLASAAPVAAAVQPVPLQPDPLADVHAPPSAIVDYGPTIVFFDSGSARITDQGTGILRSFIGFIQHHHRDLAVVVVMGNSDRAGSETANLAISCRRAIAVRRWLLANGLRGKRINAFGFGESMPLVATADGDQDPQNRYAAVRGGRPNEVPPGAIRCAGSA